MNGPVELTSKAQRDLYAAVRAAGNNELVRPWASRYGCSELDVVTVTAALTHGRLKACRHG